MYFQKPKNRVALPNRVWSVWAFTLMRVRSLALLFLQLIVLTFFYIVENIEPEITASNVVGT
jgi:hypothetical protein